jgi:hypothetical protein
MAPRDDDPIMVVGTSSYIRVAYPIARIGSQRSRRQGQSFFLPTFGYLRVKVIP